MVGKAAGRLLVGKAAARSRTADTPEPSQAPASSDAKPVCKAKAALPVPKSYAPAANLAATADLTADTPEPIQAPASPDAKPVCKAKAVLPVPKSYAPAASSLATTAALAGNCRIGTVQNI